MSTNIVSSNDNGYDNVNLPIATYTKINIAFNYIYRSTNRSTITYEKDEPSNNHRHGSSVRTVRQSNVQEEERTVRQSHAGE